MFNILIALGVFSGLFILLLASVTQGRRYGLAQIAKHPNQKIEVLSVAEGAVFALLGLLIAFTFSGAYERFDARKLQVVDEANAIETAFLRLDLLAPATQADLRRTFHEYMDSRLKIYAHLPFLKTVITEWHHTEELEDIMWGQAVAACKTTGDTNITQFVLSSINSMFDIAYARHSSIKIHSPIIIFVLLIGLAMLSAFLVGFATAKHQDYHSIYIFIYVLITAFTIYIILDLEFPRAGLIRVDSFDKVLIDMQTHLHL